MIKACCFCNLTDVHCIAFGGWGARYLESLLYEGEVKDLRAVQECRDAMTTARQARSAKKPTPTLSAMLDLELSGSKYVFNPIAGRTNVSLWPRKDMG